MSRRRNELAWEIQLSVNNDGARVSRRIASGAVPQAGMDIQPAEHMGPGSCRAMGPIGLCAHQRAPGRSNPCPSPLAVRNNSDYLDKKLHETGGFRFIAASLLIALGCSAWAQEAKQVAFTPARHTFTCEVPMGWVPFEEETPSGSATHLLGPAEADGAWRAAIHIHFMEKDKPGFIPLEESLKRERRSDKATDRQVSPLFRWRVGRYPARRFEVVETRQLPFDRLPSRPVILHHYYAFVPAGDGYFIVKLSSTRDTYLDYRNDFDNLLNTFRILGYP